MPRHECPHQSTVVEQGKVFSCCDLVQIWNSSSGRLRKSPGWMSPELSVLCRKCNVPKLLEANPCAHLNVGLTASDALQQPRITSACSLHEKQVRGSKCLQNCPDFRSTATAAGSAPSQPTEFRDIEQASPGAASSALCTVCGGSLIFVRQIDGAYAYPVDPDGQVNTDLGLERFDGAIYEEFMCLRSPEHDMPTSQQQFLRERIDAQTQERLRWVQEKAAIDLLCDSEVNRHVDRFQFVKKGIEQLYQE